METKGLSKKTIITVIASVAVLALILVLVLIENSGKGRFIISNETGRDLDRVVVGFVDTEGDFTDMLFSSPVAAGKKYDDKEDVSFTFYGSPAEMAIGYTFAGTEQVMLADGWFETEFDGKIKIRFYEKGGKTYLSMKATDGLFGSTDRTNLDVTFVLDVDNCEFDYVD